MKQDKWQKSKYGFRTCVRDVEDSTMMSGTQIVVANKMMLKRECSESFGALGGGYCR